MKNILSLKFGRLKSWHFESEKGKALLDEYDRSYGSDQFDISPRQREILCKLIDECDGDTILLEWNDIHVSKEDAKKYVMNYHTRKF